MPTTVSWRTKGGVLIAFALIFAIQTTFSYTQKSATWDEPVHVLDGYASLTRLDFRFDIEHPPFFRMFAALPLVGRPLVFDTSIVDRTDPVTWSAETLFRYASQFLYVDNDGDPLLYRARFMTVLLGVLLGLLVFSWAHEWLGFSYAVLALAAVAFEPNIVANYSLVTTDGAFTTFVFGAIYFLWRLFRQASVANAIGVIAFTALASITKFTAILLLPAVFVLLAVAVVPLRRITPRFAVVVMLSVVVACWFAVWAIYAFRYEPSSTPGWTYRLQDLPFAQERVPTLSSLIGWVDRWRLLPNAFSQGFLIGQAKAQVRDAFLAGQYSLTGWWYFFPVAILIKTPISLLALAIAGLVALKPWKTDRGMTAFCIFVPIVIFLGTSMLAKINIGLRHVLVIYPFLILAAAFSVRLMVERWRSAGIGFLFMLAAFWGLEVVRAYPHTLAFFNTLVGGPAHGQKYLADSNLDWGQDLKPLKAWMDQNHVAHINLAYFGSADPSYYDLSCTYLNGSPPFVPPQSVRAPRLPGYVAISATLLNGVYSGGDVQKREYYKPLLSQTPLASIGHSINVYWVDRPWR